MDGYAGCRESVSRFCRASPKTSLKRCVSLSRVCRRGIGLRVHWWKPRKQRLYRAKSPGCHGLSPPVGAKLFKVRKIHHCHTTLTSKHDKCLYLQDGEVFKNTVHHVLLRQVFELVDEVDHVLAHGRAVDSVDALSSLQAGVLRLSRKQTKKRGRVDALPSPKNGSPPTKPVLTSTFSTTCLPNEQTLVETVMVMFSWLLYWLLTP